MLYLDYVMIYVMFYIMFCYIGHKIMLWYYDLCSYDLSFVMLQNIYLK